MSWLYESLEAVPWQFSIDNNVHDAMQALLQITLKLD